MSIRFWGIGAVAGRSPEILLWSLPSVLLGLLILVPLTRPLASLALNSAVARGLGVRLAWVRGLTLALTVVLTALAVAVVGPVGLIALAAPEMARFLAGSRGVPILNAALNGALLMIIADWAGRSILAPLEIPVGVVTALVGGPYLLWTLIRQPTRRSP